MASSIRPSDRGCHGGAKRPLRGQSLKDVQSLRMVKNHPPLTDDDDDGNTSNDQTVHARKCF